jgi:hypothetical protein
MGTREVATCRPDPVGRYTAKPAPCALAGDQRKAHPLSVLSRRALLMSGTFREGDDSHEGSEPRATGNDSYDSAQDLRPLDPGSEQGASPASPVLWP